MEPTAELKQAVKKYREGKSEAFTQLYEESSRYIYTCIYKVMGANDNVQDAVCDIMQDTYVEISRNISQLDNESSFLSWAGTIATRKCYRWLEKNRKYVLLHEDDDTFENLADDDNIIPEEIMQDREKQRLIREIIDKQLTEMQRLCIIAFYYNEQKQSEIARELGIPENTVKTNLSRAKAKIKGGVLDLEKKQGTRLYSVAPLLLLLFREDVSACTVPASVTAAVSHSVPVVGKSGIKHLFTKMAGASTKAKIVTGVIGAGAAITAGSVTYVAVQGEPWEKEFKEYLLRDDLAEGFDLNDFEEDGIPELIVLRGDGSILVRYSDEYEDAGTFEFNAADEVDVDGDFIIRSEYRYGYDMAESRLLRLNNFTVDFGKGEEDYNYECAYLQFEDGDCETWEAVAWDIVGTDIYPDRWSYGLVEGDDRTEISDEDAFERMTKAYRRFNEIEYTDITEKDIKKRFKEFKENGNRKRARGDSSIMRELDDLEVRYGQTEEVSDEMSDADVEAEVAAEEVTLSEKEQKGIETLAAMLSLNSYFFSDDMYGDHYPVDDVPINMKLIDALGNMGLTNSFYMDYLPPTEMDNSTFIRYCKPEAVQDYLKNVFGIENADLSAYCEDDRIVFDMIGDYALVDVFIDDPVMRKDDIYTMDGEFVLWLADMLPEVAYSFEFTAKKNDASPFGFQVISMEYKEEVTEDYESTELAAAGDSSLSGILLNPEGNSTYYPQEVEYNGLYFALVDIDKDGEDEILLGTPGDTDYFGDPIWMTIFNILKYDRNSDEVSDYDGDMVYKPLDANSWHYYDTGWLMTMAEVGNGHANFWNLITGEFIDTSAVIGEYSYLAKANPEYESLTSGNEIPIIWSEVNQANIDAFLSGGTVEAVNISFPKGSYKSNRGAELNFWDDSSVQVSEGGSSHTYDYTIDSMGNIVIDPGNEALEGTYNSAADELNFYNIKYRKYK